MYNGYVYDMEADNLYLESKVIWYINFRSLDGKRELEVFPFRETKEKVVAKIQEWHESFGENPLVVGFNNLGYDQWMLWRHLGIKFSLGKGGSDWLFDEPCTFLDLYVFSMYLDPDRPRHSLRSYGEELGNFKMDFHDFSKYSEEMRTYGRQDVKLTLDIFNHLRRKSEKVYQNVAWLEKSFKSMQKDYLLYAAQGFTGIRFDLPAAKKLVEDIAIEMKEIEDLVLPKLPPRKLKKGEEKIYTMPAKPYKANGEFSSHMLSFIEKHNLEVIDNQTVVFEGKQYRVTPQLLLDKKVPMEIKDGDDLKEWFMENGWVPTMYNFKRGADGKPERDEKGEVINTSPKLQEQGKICPNLLKLDGELPKQIVRFLSLRNRQSVVTGWINDPRLNLDGRLSAEITGYTPTTRVKHSKIVNLPKASPEVIKGYEVRSLFIVDDGMMYTSADAAALENRTVADYTYKYDNGSFADLVLNGDSHSFNAKIFFPKQTEKFDPASPDFNKDDPLFKPWRNKAKTGAYSLAYGASVKKFTKSLGLSEREGKAAYEGYWDANQGLKKFKEAIEKYWSTTGKKKYIISRDGHMLIARSKHLLVNLAGQSLGAKVITYTACMLDNWLGDMYLDELGRPYYLYKGKVVKRLAAFHDQIDFECDPEVAEEVGAKIVELIKKAGTMLGMRVPLDGEYKVGKNAAEIH